LSLILVILQDLKADNILVENTGICKISDFSIAKRTDSENAEAFTAMCGTIFWMAPEVVKAGKKGYTSKIDIWSVGCVVLEMWAGRRPWEDEESYAVIFKVRIGLVKQPVMRLNWTCRSSTTPTVVRRSPTM
jgi:serine/threonine protein kinase